MIKSKGFLIFPIVMLLLTGLYLMPVSAYTTNTLTDDVWETYSSVAGEDNRRNAPPYQRAVRHSSGKYVYAGIVDSDSDNIHVYVESSAGVLLSDVDTNIVCAGGLSILEFDTDEVVIAGSNTAGTGIGWFKVNIISFAVSAVVTTTMASLSGATACRALSNIVYSPTTGRFYAMLSCRAFTSGTGYAVFYYTGSAGAQIAKITVTTGANTALFAYLDETNQHIYYWVYLSGTWHLHDFAIGAGTLTDIATAPFAGGMPTDGAKNAGYGNYFDIYGAGIYSNTTHFWVYMGWCFSERGGTWSPLVAGVRFVDTWFWYVHFSGSISAGTIVSNVRIMDSRSDGSASTSVSSGLGCGYIFNNPTSPTFDVYTYRQDIYAGKYVSRYTYHITDIETDPTDFDTETELKGCDGLDWSYQGYDGANDFNPTHGYSTACNSDTSCKFTIGGPILAKVYTFTVSHSPADSPLGTGTTYTFTFTVYVNGVVDTLGEDYILYVDGVNRASDALPTSGTNSGKAIVTLSFSSEKEYALLLSVYNTGVLQANSEVYEYEAVNVGGDDDDLDPPVLIPNYSYMFTGFIPIAFITLGPILMLGVLGSKMGGAGAMVGMIIGAIIGVIAGVQTSVLPSYVIYIMAMAVIAGLVVFVRMGGSSGGD